MPVPSEGERKKTRWGFANGVLVATLIIVFAFLAYYSLDDGVPTEPQQIEFAAEPHECLTQTWKGTIGDVPVMIEFEEIPSNNPIAGRYYYRSSLDELLLIQDSSNEARWKEYGPKGQITGYITATCEGNVLSGKWQSPDGSRTLKMAAISTPGLSYNQPRLEAIKPVVVARKALGGHQFDLLNARGVNSVTGLRLIGEGIGIAKVNGILMDEFLQSIVSALSCKSSLHMQRGEVLLYEGDEESPVNFWMSVVAWNEAFVVIKSAVEGFCGGASPFHNRSVSVYNLESGSSENVALWLTEDYREDIQQGSSLEKVLMKQYWSNRGDDDCLDEIKFQGTDAWPTSNGMVFLPSTIEAMRACADETIIPYSIISPYLSARGKSAVQSFQVQ